MSRAPCLKVTGADLVPVYQLPDHQDQVRPTSSGRAGGSGLDAKGRDQMEKKAQPALSCRSTHALITIAVVWVFAVACIPAIAASPKYTFDRFGFFCFGYSDAKEFTQTIYGRDGNADFLLKSERCVSNLGRLPPERVKYDFLEVIRAEYPQFDICKMRIHFDDIVNEVFTSCATVLRDGREYILKNSDGYGTHSEWGARFL